MNKMIITISIMLMSLTLNAQIQDSTSVKVSSVQHLSTKDSLYMKMLSEISDQLQIWSHKDIRYTRQRICIIS